MSWVVGYAVGQQPTFTDADVDNLWESESARIWEEQNAPSKDESKYLAAAKELEKAIKALDQVIDALVEAENAADGVPLADKVAFFARDFEDRQCDLKRMMEKAQRSEED